MKHGHTLREKSVEQLRKSMGNGDDDESVASSESSARELTKKVKKPNIWYIGTFFFVTGSILNFVSFSFAAQSLLAALGSAQFISNVFFGRVILGEVVTLQTIFATFVIIAGNALVVLFSSHESVIYTADNLIEFYNTTYICYALAMVVLVAAMVTTYRTIEARVKMGEYVKHSNLSLPLLFAASSAILGTQR